MFLIENEMNEIKGNFEVEGCLGFLGIIGVIDGIYIRIRVLIRYFDVYINRKKFYFFVI